MAWCTRLQRSQRDHPVVDYVLLAEFDIDTGSTLRHQYPSPVPDCKADWFAEHMLPEGAHNRQSDYTYMFLNRDGKHIDEDIWIKPSTETSAPDADSSEPVKFFLYGINLVKTRHDSTVRRGAIVKSMCIFSRYHFVESFKEPLDLALESYFDNPSVDVLKDFFDALNSIDISSLPRPDYLESLLMRRGVKYLPLHCSPIAEHLPSYWMRSLRMDYCNQTLALPVRTHCTPDEVGDINISQLIRVFGESSMKIFHAVLTKQRVLFVGYNHATSDIAQMVLSAVAMVAPPLTGLIRRTFPYANLADLGFLESKGFVAGVTNPMFQQREKWWDILCVLDLPNNTGTVIESEPEERSRGGVGATGSGAGGSSSGNASRSTASGAQVTDEMLHIAADQKFYQTVLSGIQARLGEEWVRQQFLDYSTSIFQHTLDKGLFLNQTKLTDNVKRTLEANQPRMAQLDACAEFQSMPSNLWTWTRVHDQSPDSDDTNGLILKTYVRKLKYESGLDSAVETEIFFDFIQQRLVSESALQALLVMLPESQGGILPIASGLFSALPTVRLATVQLLKRIEAFPSTNPALGSLTTFMRYALQRQSKQFEDGSLAREVEEYRSQSVAGQSSTSSEVEDGERQSDINDIVDSVIETIRQNSIGPGQLVEALENFL